MKKILLLIVVLLVNACVYEFNPKLKSDTLSSIVVEGDIIAGGLSKFTFSNLLPLSGPIPKTKVVPKSLFVECEDGTIYKSFVGGDPSLGAVNVNTTSIDTKKRHRLVFTILNPESNTLSTYQSAWSDCINTPPIDSLNFVIAKDSTYMTINVNTHSDIDSLKYYRWEFSEDWEIHSVYRSEIQYNRPYPNDRGTDPLKSIAPINFDTENRYYCWMNMRSLGLYLANTLMLKENVISQFPITYISSDNNRLSYLYSIEVVQRALSKEGFDYWSAIKRNNYNIGGLFSPQPNEIRGNVTCKENPEEVVLGYIGVCTLEKKRMFIDVNQAKIYSFPRKNCNYQDVDPGQWFWYYMNNFDIISFDEMTGKAGWAQKDCVDCRVIGSKFKPSYWPNNHK